MADSENKRPGPNESVSQRKIADAIRADDSRAITAPKIAEEADLTVKTVYKHLPSVLEEFGDIKTQDIGGTDAYWSDPVTAGGYSDGGIATAAALMPTAKLVTITMAIVTGFAFWLDIYQPVSRSLAILTGGLFLVFAWFEWYYSDAKDESAEAEDFKRIREGYRHE